MWVEAGNSLEGVGSSLPHPLVAQLLEAADTPGRRLPGLGLGIQLSVQQVLGTPDPGKSRQPVGSLVGSHFVMLLVVVVAAAAVDSLDSFHLR